MTTREYEPWFVVRVGARKNRKIVGLPNDTARLGWFLGVLAEAKQLRPAGRFTSRAQLLEAIGRFGEHVDAYIVAGLLHEAPRLCPDCRKRWGQLPGGTIVVHDWHRHQRDPGAPERAANWRGERAENDPSTQDERATNDEQTQDERGEYENRTLGVTADSRAHRPAREARPRAVAGPHETETDTTKRESGTPSVGRRARANGGEPALLTADELAAWAEFTAPEWAPFRSAWLARGFRKPPGGTADDDDTSQRGLLWQIADARPRSLAEWVTEAPGRTARTVIDHVLARWHETRALAVEEEPAWHDPDRTATPAKATEVLAEIAERSRSA